MAKFGERQDDYDPFNQISSSLAALGDPPPKPESGNHEGVDSVEPAPGPGPVQDTIREPVAKARTTAQELARTDSGEDKSASIPQPEPKSLESSVALCVVKRFKTTQVESQEIDLAMFRLSAKLGVRTDLSKITRALWDTYIKHEDEILRSMDPNKVGKRPNNQDAIGLAEFDERLAEQISEGLMMACMRQRS